MLALDFRTFLENMKMSSLLSKILETGIKVFKTIYECVEKLIMIICCNIWMICLIKLIFLRSESWMQQLSEFLLMLRSSVCVVFNNFFLIDATDRSKISSDRKRLFFAVSLYPLSFFCEHSLYYEDLKVKVYFLFLSWI